MNFVVTVAVLFASSIKLAEFPLAASDVEDWLRSLVGLLVLLKLLSIVSVEALPKAGVIVASEVHTLLDHHGSNRSKLLAWNGVSVHVQVQIRLLSKRLSTDRALVRALTTVDPSVDLHVVLESEAFGANVTLVRLLSGVRDAVTPKFAGIRAHHFAVFEVTGEESGNRWLLGVLVLDVPF